jgi:hypothetical protein
MQAKITVNYKALNLVKLGQMSVIQSFVPKHTVNRKEFMRFEGLLISYTFEIARRNSGSVSSENVFESFLRLPLVVIAQTSEPSLFMNVPHCFKVLFILDLCHFRMRNEEGVMCVSGRVSLWLK